MPINPDGTLETEEDVVTAFEELFKDADKPSDDKEKSDKKEKPETTEEEVEETEDTSDEDAQDETEDAEEPSEDEESDDDATEDKPKSKKYTDDDDIYTKIKVGEEEHEVSVKELKRLWGQEASLTKKSQEVAARTKQAEENTARAVAALDVMVKRAQEASKPYRDLNWAALMKNPEVSADMLSALQADAKAAMDNETFLTGQMDAFMTHIRTEQANAQRSAAAEALKSLTTEGSTNYIKGWNNDLYNSIREFAVGQGLDRTMVDGLTDPAAFKMLNMAMQFHKGSQKVAVTKPTNKSPKKIVKNTAGSTPPNKATNQLVKRKEAIAKQKKAGGSMASTVDAFEALLGGD
jgi:hypothetical protein